jgi:hypothetical protein
MAMGIGGAPQTTFPTYSFATDAIVNSGIVSVQIDSINDDDNDDLTATTANLPLNITLLIDGEVVCGLYRGPKCRGYEWRPDLDAELIAPDNSQADFSTCMLDSDTDCGTVDSGRQETLIDNAAAAGQSTYTLEVYIGTNNYTAGDFSYEVSTGPLVVGTTMNPSVVIASDNLNPNNTVPVADDQGVVTNEDTGVQITLTANDAESDPMSFVILSNPSDGSLSGSAPDLTYTPDPDFNGSNGFTFTTNDGFGNGNTATVSITVSAVDDPPELAGNIADQNAVVDTPFSHDVSANFSDVDGDTLTYWIAVTDWLSISSAGVLSGTPSSTGDTRSVTVTASDGSLSVDSNTFTVIVNEPSAVESVASLADGGSTNHGKTWTANVNLSVEAGGDPVSSALVDWLWSTGASGTCASANCSISESGIAKKNGTVTLSVTGVTVGVSDPAWDGALPSIIVSKP